MIYCHSDFYKGTELSNGSIGIAVYNSIPDVGL